MPGKRCGLLMDKPVRIYWRISDFRKDERTGPLRCVPRSKYAEELYRAAMRRWH
ncbi:MAG: hypothetical protein K6T78_08120 [Alicyclobacillus sp.]|nr:hypothetical protein [Alicyclobacillus sp.]